MNTTATQEKLLNAARILMLDKGYPATTVDEICEKAGVSKGSFYHAYSSKEELSLALLEWYHAGGSQQIFNGPFTDVADPGDRMLAFVDHVSASSQALWGNGCLLANLGMELANTHPRIRGQVASLFDRLQGRLAGIFAPAAQSGASGPDGRQLAEEFLMMMEGAILLARVSQDWGIVHRGFANFKNRLQGLMMEARTP